MANRISQRRTLILPFLLLQFGIAGQLALAQTQYSVPNTLFNVSDTADAFSVDIGSAAHFSLADQFDARFLLTQTEPDDDVTPVPRPTISRSVAAISRRRRSTSRLPSMFGDFYGGSSLQANIQLPSQRITQLFVDNVGGQDFFVTNANGGQGADSNLAVAIQVRQGNQNGMVIATSNGNGVPSGQSLSFPINEPVSLRPPGVDPNNLTYESGVAFYAGPNPPGPINNGEGWGLQFSHLFTPNPVLVNLPAGGGAVRRVKVAENNSPIPRDRFIFNYNFFNDVIGGIGDVNRYAVGMEKTFWNESSSVQVLFPMASTLDVDQIAGGRRSTDTEFGDLTLIFKTLLWEQEDFLVAAGVGLAVPTGDDARVFDTTGQQIIDLQHDSTHVLPYIAMLHTYDSGLYWQSFVQLDVDANGNPLSADLTGMSMQPAGVLQDQTLLFVDLGLGYWLHPPGEQALAMAATAELHWAGTLQDADVVNAAGINVTSAVNRYDVLNLTLGAAILVHDRFTIRPAMVVPLHDDQFDYEAIVQANFWR